MRLKQILLSLVMIVMVVSCANRGNGPQGGLRDNRAPKFVMSSPSPSSVHFAGKSIELEFDEYVQLSNPQSLITVSPPQLQKPSYSASGRKVRIEFNDTLQSNITYSIDFADAIRDINEGNSVKNLHYTFSTGEQLDTMEISGLVVSGADLTPQNGITVVLYDGKSDAPMSQIPLYVSRTDTTGRFTFRGLKNGTYQVCALSDNNFNLILDDGEPFAFLATPVKTYFETESYSDTLRHYATEDPVIRREMRKSVKRNPRRAYVLRDSMAVDSVVLRSRTHYYPDNLVLLLSIRERKQQYLIKTERKQEHVVTFYMNDTTSVRPQIHLLEKNPGRIAFRYSNRNDTITCYITDEGLCQKDTLRFSVSYVVKDTAYHLKDQTDTVSAYYRHVHRSKGSASPSGNAGQYSLLLPRKEVSIHEPLRISSSTPMVLLDMSHIHLYCKKDTALVEEPLPILVPVLLDSMSKEKVALAYECRVDWDSEKTYFLRVDSAATMDILGRSSKSSESEFSIKGADQFSSLMVSVFGGDLSKCRIQLLDAKKGEVIRERLAESDGTLFEYLNPGEYRIRLYVDDNGDGFWTPGDWKSRKQPETVYNFNGTIRLRANWDVEQRWDIDFQ